MSQLEPVRMSGSGPVEMIARRDPTGHCSLCGRRTTAFVDVTTNGREMHFRGCVDCVSDMWHAIEVHDG